MKPSKLVKQGLAFIAAIYLALVVVSLHDSPFSRSLQEGNVKAQEVAGTDIIVIVMGERGLMPVWTERLRQIDASLTLLYGSFDHDLPTTPECESEYGLVCQTAYIPGTTWTEGRNLLAAEALRMEKRRGKQYDYWIFLDDDADVTCTSGEPMEKLLGEGSCWQKVFNFIGSDLVPENISTISLAGGPPQGYRSVTNADAMFAAFKRSHVPYILPYATLPEGASQWTSQSVLFCIMETCMESSVLLIPYVGGRNGAHREYARGLNIHEIRSVIANNYHDEEAGFLPCPGGPSSILNGAGSTIEFETKEELNDFIPPTQFETCAPMKTRFETWESAVIDDLNSREKTSEIGIRVST